MSVLDRIASINFISSVGFDLPAEAMRLVLQRTPEFQAFQQALESGQMSDVDLERFVTQLMEQFTRGEKFRFDVTLAFLAVALERVGSTFAEMLLPELGRLRVSELPLSTRVARVCLQYRRLLPTSRETQFGIAPIAEMSTFVPSRGTPRSVSHNDFIVGA